MILTALNVSTETKEKMRDSSRILISIGEGSVRNGPDINAVQAEKERLIDLLLCGWEIEGRNSHDTFCMYFPTIDAYVEIAGAFPELLAQGDGEFSRPDTLLYRKIHKV